MASQDIRPIVAEGVRKIYDLSDASRAIAVAARLMTSQLDALEIELLELLRENGEPR